MTMTPEQTAVLAQDLAQHLIDQQADFGQTVYEDDNGEPEGVLVLVTDPMLSKSLLSFLSIWKNDMETTGKASLCPEIRKPAQELLGQKEDADDDSEAI